MQTKAGLVPVYFFNENSVSRVLFAAEKAPHHESGSVPRERFLVARMDFLFGFDGCLAKESAGKLRGSHSPRRTRTIGCGAVLQSVEPLTEQVPSFKFCAILQNRKGSHALIVKPNLSPLAPLRFSACHGNPSGKHCSRSTRRVSWS